MRTGSADVRLQGGTGSTGRRNTGVKSFCWGFKLQGLTWSFVELTSHFVQIGLRVHRQVGALWKVLSQQAIGFLVRPALPRALGFSRSTVAIPISVSLAVSLYQFSATGSGASREYRCCRQAEKPIRPLRSEGKTSPSARTPN